MGDHLDVALLDIMLSTLVYEAQAAQATGPGPGKTVYRPAKARDEFVIIAAITDRNFRSLVGAMGRPDLLTDERFATMPAREENWETWQDIIADWVRDQDAAQVEKDLLAQGVPCSRFRSVAEALADEHLIQRGTLRRAEDPAGGYDFVGPPFQSATAPYDGRSVPVATLGQHNADVLPG
jgi:crotonobetainyl-CoA:carnitine CoA-transferase CaiB-like acyl-CoA transferase